MFKISQGVKDIARHMIENPLDWVQTDHRYVHRLHTDIAIWTANGTFGMRLHGNDGLSWAEKKFLNDAIKQSIANRLSIKKSS